MCNRGVALVALNRPQDALEAYDEVVRRFGKSETPALLEFGCDRPGEQRSRALGALNRPQDALEAYDEVVRRFGRERNSRPFLKASCGRLLCNRGAALDALNRPQDAAGWLTTR